MWRRPALLCVHSLVFIRVFRVNPRQNGFLVLAAAPREINSLPFLRAFARAGFAFNFPDASAFSLLRGRADRSAPVRGRQRAVCARPARPPRALLATRLRV